MASRSEIITVYSAGLVQGIGLVTFPAASAVFTNPHDYGLSSTAYGGLFLPQALFAIAASLLGAGLRKRIGSKSIYLLGLLANLMAMCLLVFSRFVMHDHSLAYGILLGATSCMGIGFGLTVPALNTFVAAFFPKKMDRSVLTLNALLGLGTALAPVFIGVFIGLGIWWGLPVLVGILFVVLLGVSFSLPLNEDRSDSGKKQKAKIPARFWMFAAFAMLYGVCETMNGNWASLCMTDHFKAGPSLAAMALTVFWATVTGGRVLFATIDHWLPERIVCRVLPIIIAIAFAGAVILPKPHAIIGIFTFALAGLGCSALLPLVISFGQQQLTAISASVAGGLIAFYQIGYGIAAFGVGPLQSWAGWSLYRIYGGTTVIALILFIFSFAVTRKTQPDS